MKVCMVKPTMAAFDSYSPGGSHERFGSRDSGVIFHFVTHSSYSDKVWTGLWNKLVNC